MHMIALTADTFEATINQNDKAVLVDFWAEWCSPCRSVCSVLEEIAGELGDQVIIGKVDVEAEQELAVRYRVSAIPTLLFFRGGQLVETLRGVHPKSRITASLAPA